MAVKTELPAKRGEGQTALANILIVDDLPEKHMVYKTILEELGQNLIFASSGEEALKQVLLHEFAVILLDVNMPGMDGFETASMIRKRKRSQKTPIIFLTAFVDEIHAAQGYASGAVDYLPTPVVPEILRAKVRVFIELSQMRQQAALRAEEKVRRLILEDAARRSDFLVTVSEMLAGLKNQLEFLDMLLLLPIPALADVSAISFCENEKQPERMKWAWKDMKEQNTAPLLTPLLSAVPWLRKIINQVLEEGQLQFLDQKALEAAQRSEGGSSLLSHLHSMIVLPVAGQETAKAVLILARDRTSQPYDANDVSTARSLASRASIAFDNISLIQRIQEADRRKDEFLAMLAHELRNPLAPISNALEVMQMVGSPDDRLTEVRQIMQRQVRHMNRLVDDLLDVSRITRGKIEIRKEKTDLAQVIGSAVETSRSLIEQGNHRFSVDLPENPVLLSGDPTRLAQVFSNLLNNAAKYTERGGEISITAIVKGINVEVTVRDNGIGIPATMQPRIFDIFTQVDSSIERAQGGLGIGLKLVKELCELHGGSVRVSSEGKGKGTEFIVSLPVSISEVPKDQPPALQDKDSSHCRVLIVDDNMESAKTLRWMLELLGHEVQAAYDGPTAIATAGTFRPHIVLLDIGLPGMNGYEVCRAMRADRKLAGTFFAAQTGWGQDEHRQRSREAGFDCHLVKPIELSALKDLIRDYQAPGKQALQN